MIDWNLVAKIAGGGFGAVILVLAILMVITMVLGLIFRRTKAAKKKED